ncbi:hypothetical protein [Micromonospora globbae]|uniref:Uncharacterized protein n=1 Tax=Micromonospora globbae TaxID=1894969 RepID=A0A420EX00_9ACTN|nr:hypothetical protein [Micromonospora globbae]RKF25239.1 hypothetical protein D7I43_22560 [Micromonospora globbae]
MTHAQVAELFAEAVLQKCAELLYRDMRPEIDAHAARRQAARKQAAPAPAAPAPAVAGNVVDLGAWRARRAARAGRARVA